MATFAYIIKFAYMQINTRVCKSVHLKGAFRWTQFGIMRFTHRWTTLVFATLRITDDTDKWNSWLADVSFDWHHVIEMAVQHNPKRRFIISSTLILQDLNQNFTNNEQKRCKNSSKHERNGSRAKLTWLPSGVTYFARDPLRSYIDEPQKNETYFLNTCTGGQGHSLNFVQGHSDFINFKQLLPWSQ